MRHATRCVLVLSFALIVVAGCKSEDGTSPDLGASDLSVVDLIPEYGHTECAAWAQVVCDKIDSCAPYVLRTNHGDKPTCKNEWTVLCERVIVSPTRPMMLQGLSACTAAITGLTCAQEVRGLFSAIFIPDADIVAACRGVAGPQASDTNCASQAQCQSQRCDTRTSTCGTCITPAAVGGDCSTPLDCEAGLACVNAKCAAIAQLTEACDGAKVCGFDAWCKNGTCVPWGAEGDDCAPNGTPTCRFYDGLTCSPGTSKCVKIVESGKGSPCNRLSTGEQADCVGHTRCHLDNVRLGFGTCNTAVGYGAVCEVPPRGAQDPCAFPARCIDGVCALADQNSCHG